MRTSRLIFFIVGIVASGLFSGCGKNAPSPVPPPQVVQKKAESEKASIYAWNVHTSVEVYKKAGHTHPKWDAEAEQALGEFASYVSGMSSNDATATISNACMSAMAAGCDDPLIHYLALQFARDPAQNDEDNAKEFSKAAEDLESSAYPPIRKFWGWARALRQAETAYPVASKAPDWVRGVGYYEHGTENLRAALKDKTMPTEMICSAAKFFLDLWSGDNRYDNIYEMVVNGVDGDRAKSAPMLKLKGKVYIQKAWKARGGGYANTVSKEGWKIFERDIALAETALTKAWELSPTDPDVALDMMKVERAQGQGRDRERSWFHRAMELDPNDYEACDELIFYLSPKWYGSVEDMLEFGRECASNPKWGGRVPLILLTAHWNIYSEYISKDQKETYWTQPEVWPDLKASFDRYFEVNPKETHWYNNYAWYAHAANQWGALNEILPKIYPTNYQYFGGVDKFEAMVAEAKNHAGK